MPKGDGKPGGEGMRRWEVMQQKVMFKSRRSRGTRLISDVHSCHPLMSLTWTCKAPSDGEMSAETSKASMQLRVLLMVCLWSVDFERGNQSF
eukprot:1150440-Pelagomonas_calceolata.AAC.4